MSQQLASNLLPHRRLVLDRTPHRGLFFGKRPLDVRGGFTDFNPLRCHAVFLFIGFKGGIAETPFGVANVEIMSDSPIRPGPQAVSSLPHP